ncbi:sensor domain-containing diguanylate cyclase [Desulfopila aestuarii]|uniref:diguanylate cyclase n=1 Tax=Desulfopila aestuarii DSM 18488 TaxID=1121416 RepID=A0A1M7YGH9_9BACT|nr:GGDEF domain-containing protein [Desulfopila aestuarii]SHO51720.1 diguanylate cyclase (GGDEF) domain-containing protein [Desulfopila aestuarii DSM 18488]
MITLQEFLEEKVRLPSPKAIAIRILEAIRKDEDSFAELANIIKSDPVLTARILKVANSSYYGMVDQVSSPGQAISVLGTKALKNIALSFVIFDAVKVTQQGSFDIDLFWRRAITSAVAAEIMAAEVGFRSDDIFVTALLQDFGVLVLFLSCGAAYTEVFDAKRISGSNLQEEETKHLSFNHTEVGYQILKSWNLPDTICEPIRDHHSPKKPGQTSTAGLVNLADRIASIYHGKESNRRSIEARMLLNEHYGINDEHALELIDTIGIKAREAIELFAISPGEMKPFSQIMQEANTELARLNYSYEQLVLELTQAKRNAEQMAVELKKANDSLRDLALRDGLTGLYNHRYFQDALASQLESSKRYGHMVALLLIDIDFFKKINDTHGHPVGDTVLQEISTLLVKLVRNCDIVARYGGEEFAVILPETGITGAKVLAHRVRRGVEQHQIKHGDIPIPITISIGVASSESSGAEISRSMLITQCDQALYEAKHNGRNRVEVASGEMKEKSLV